VANEQVVDPVEPRVRHPRRRWLWIGLALVVVVLGWDGFRAAQIASALELADADVTQLRADVDASDWAALQDDAHHLGKDSHAAAAATHDPLWVLTTHVPWLGETARPPARPSK